MAFGPTETWRLLPVKALAVCKLLTGRQDCCSVWAASRVASLRVSCSHGSEVLRGHEGGDPRLEPPVRTQPRRAALARAWRRLMLIYQLAEEKQRRETAVGVCCWGGEGMRNHAEVARHGCLSTPGPCPPLPPPTIKAMSCSGNKLSF